MLVEIPDPAVILGVIAAFVIGLGGFYAYYKIRPFVKISSVVDDSSQAERLEYYERQLIDMKIRLDALEMQGIEQKTEDPSLELKEFLGKLVKQQVNVKEEVNPMPKQTPEEQRPTKSTPDTDYNDITDQVLHLITTKNMTSRDIQTALKKSREHTSRLLKKLFDEGYVDRNTKSKPYTYSITDKGREKIKVFESNLTVV